MPISRFLAFLEARGRTADYLTMLANAFNPTAAAGVMCRNILSVGWDGTLYDCDFNQMLELPVSATVPRSIFHADLTALEAREIRGRRRRGPPSDCAAIDTRPALRSC